MRTYHEVLRHLTHVRDRIELYELTPDKLEFDLKFSKHVTRADHLPTLKRLETELEQELAQELEKSQDILSRYFDPAARSGTAELSRGAVKSTRIFRLPEGKVGVVIVGISEEKPDGVIDDAWKQVLQSLSKVVQEPETA